MCFYFTALVIGLACQEVEGVAEQRQDGEQRAMRSWGAAGEVENEGATADSADATAQRGERRVAEAVIAHGLGEARHEALADGERGFGG